MQENQAMHSKRLSSGCWPGDSAKDAEAERRANCDVAPVADKAGRRHTRSPAGQGVSGAHAERQAAALWLSSLTGGVQVPSHTDSAFRAALRDGTILCQALNTVLPTSAVKVRRTTDHNGAEEPSSTAGSIIQNLENMQAFIKALTGLNLPGDNLFSIADLEYDGPEDRHKVVSCLLSLKALQESRDGSSQARPTVQQKPSQQQVTQAQSEASLDSMENSQPSSCDTSVVERTNSATSGGNGPTSGRMSARLSAQNVTSLMKKCTKMLEEKSWLDASRASHQQHGAGVGPVCEEAEFSGALQKTLTGLMSSYETQLLHKSTEIRDREMKLAMANEKLERLQADLAAVQQQFQAAQAAAADAAAADAKGRIAQLEAQVASLKAALAAKEAELAALRARLDSSGEARDSQLAQAQAEVARLQEQCCQLQVVEGKYRATHEENRRLYNLVQDLRGAIRVFCRIRPAGQTGDRSTSCVEQGVEEGEMAVYDGTGRKMFRFDKVFGTGSTQADVYADTQPLVRSVLDGYNVCIFAYGQTGSGKTHTMSGSDVDNAANRGINYRALDDLFALRDCRRDEVKYTIRAQMLEIYNESLRDLLCNDPEKKLDIHATQASGCNVPGAVQLDVASTQDVISMMATGSKNRHMAETKMNQRSSRSHSILTVIVDGVNYVTGAKSHGCLHLVDLAGSERVSRSEATGDRLTEAQHINKSLSALGDVMAALAGKQAHVPFRNSKLTQLLADSLAGQAKVLMFMHIAPEGSSMAESISTLKFGMRVSEITLGQAKRNVESGKVFEAQEQVVRLKAAGEGKEALIEQLRAQLEAERAEKEALAKENASLLARLDRERLERRRSSLQQMPRVPPPAMLLEAAAAPAAGPLSSAAPGEAADEFALPPLSISFTQPSCDARMPNTPTLLPAGVSQYDGLPPTARSRRTSDFGGLTSRRSSISGQQPVPEATALVTPQSARSMETLRGADSMSKHIQRMHRASTGTSGRAKPAAALPAPQSARTSAVLHSGAQTARDRSSAGSGSVTARERPATSGAITARSSVASSGAMTALARPTSAAAALSAPKSAKVGGRWA